DSEISRVNRSGVGESMALSPAFAEVLQAALDVGARSAGAYDITVGPLVDLWGFGAGSDADWVLPSPDKVEHALTRVGQSALKWDARRGTLVRRRAVTLDFSSIAKGYGVDRVAGVLEAQGLVDYLVEVGGEMRVSGVSPRGDAWRVAVEKPVAGQTGVAEALEVTDIAVATSGDYRNFVEVDGKRYSHTLDPRTGYPVTHNLVSVTVLHERCMMADAWATALSVVGLDEALRLAAENDLAVYLITRDGDALQSQGSPAFTARFGAVER
ncbi:MAG: FAD:protein FMN transferase, partial [Chromatocurvus sp.]